MSKIFAGRLGGVSVAGLLSLVVALPALGQVAPVQNGRALDVNPQVGSRGSNGAASSGSAYSPINGNDIITGNVTGLGYFHDRIPYGSPLQFHGSLPSSSLNSFVRTSSGGYGPAASLGQARPFYAPSALVSTDAGRVNSGLALSGSSNHSESTLTGAGSISSTVAAGAGGGSDIKISSVPFSGVPSLQDYQRLSSQRLAPGIDQLDNDSLFGLRRSLEAAPVDPRTLLPVNPEDEAIKQTNNNDVLNPNPLPSQGRTGLRKDQPPDELLDSDAAPARPKDMGPVEQVNDRILDRPLRSPMLTPRLSTTPGEMPDAIGKFAPIHVSAPFEDQLASLRYDPKARSVTELAGATPEEGVPDNTRFSMVSKNSAAATSRLMRARLAARSSARTDTNTNTDAGTPGAPGTDLVGPPSSGTQPAEAPALPQTGGTVVPASEYIARANGELKDGLYLQAADTFQSALRVEPDNTVALLGRAHAEFAGGLYVSAVFDLKYFFNVEPGKIADRHNMVTMLTGKRVDFLEKDLLALEQKNPRTPADFLFLLSYLYYQTGREEDLKSTFERWSKDVADDPWPAALKKVWVTEKTLTAPPGG